MFNFICRLFQVSIQRLGACVAVREDIARVLRSAGMFVVARQVPDPLAAATRGVRAPVGRRRAATPVARQGPAQRAASQSAGGPGPARPRHPPTARLPLNASRKTLSNQRLKPLSHTIGSL